MNKGRRIRCYDYVNRPYERVRDALSQNALTVFQSATRAAASRAQSIAAELHVDIGGIGVKTDIKISLKSVDEKFADVISTPTTRLLLEWEAATSPRLFPFMEAELSIYSLTSTETQLDFSGRPLLREYYRRAYQTLTRRRDPLLWAPWCRAIL